MWNRFLDWLTRLVLGPKRLDHEPLYSCTHAGVIVAALSIMIAGPIPDSAISVLPTPTQKALSACMFVGSAVCLFGIAMGTPLDVWRQAKRLLGYPNLPAMDLRRAYRVGACGTPAVMVGMGFYCATIVINAADVTGAIGASFIGFAALGMFFQCLRLLMEIRRISHTVPVLIEQEIQRRIIERWLIDD
jgi:hypothetical protein